MDADGDYWLIGRVDDVINVSGHRIGTAEVESALVATRKSRRPPSSAIRTTSRARALRLRDVEGRREAERGIEKGTWRRVRKEIGAIAVPDKIQFAPGLPKTRSGKIMRRILRKIAENQTGNRRHHDAGRFGGGRRSGQQPAEQKGGQSGRLKRLCTP